MSQSVPIKALLAFDAAMKHSSFALAADELNVTAGAVGQQIQKLEEWLGAQLFIRSVRQVLPTAEAVSYWAVIQPALARIQRASESLRQSHSNSVWLSMPPSLAAKWFAPRMAQFLSGHPEISLHLDTSTSLADFSRERVDLAIRYFDGQDPELASQILYQDEARLYCAPSYVKRLKLKATDDIARGTLIHTTLHPHWRSWLNLFSNLNDNQIENIPSLHFDQSIMAIEAARQDQGLVLSSALLTEKEVNEGTLVEPFKQRLALNKSYFVTHDKGTLLRPAVAALKDWLLSNV